MAASLLHDPTADLSAMAPPPKQDIVGAIAPGRPRAVDRLKFIDKQ
jgi:hypothetical protein